jgi:hypothetical protein
VKGYSPIARTTRDDTRGAFKGGNWKERLNTAASAKQAALEKFRARPSPDGPVAVERRAARVATRVAREARIVERNAARASENARLVVESAARAADEARQAAEQAAAAAALESERAASALELKAQQKTARDIRYAKRKARR